MNTQPEALRLADLVDDPTLAKYHEHKNIVAELRRLHKVNQMLVQRLELVKQALDAVHIDITNARLIHAENELAIGKALVNDTLAEAKDQA
jgi:hypothetical protein